MSPFRKCLWWRLGDALIPPAGAIPSSTGEARPQRPTDRGAGGPESSANRLPTQEDENAPAPVQLTAAQKRHLYHGFRSIDKLLIEIEAILGRSSATPLFPEYLQDVAAAQHRLLEGGIRTLRADLTDLLNRQQMAPQPAAISGLHAIVTHLMFAEVAIEELGAAHMRGYGTLSPGQEAEAEAITTLLRARMERIMASLRRSGAGGDLARRAAETPDSPERRLFELLEQATRGADWAEFRLPLAGLLDRLTERRLELALFGRVNSGKSSLLNAVLGTDLLPTGPTPLTSVVTRIMWSQQPLLEVSYLSAPGEEERWPIDHLPELVSEQRNPENRREIDRLVVRYPSGRLPPGIALVDTPGLGSLQAGSEAETFAYLPSCDAGVLLIDAGSTLDERDLGLLRRLRQGGAIVQILLSKADLLPPSARAESLDYLRSLLTSQVDPEISVLPVSALDTSLLLPWLHSLQPLFTHWQRQERIRMRGRLLALRDSLLSAGAETRPAQKAQSRETAMEFARERQRIQEEIGQARRMADDLPEQFARSTGEILDATIEATRQRLSSSRPDGPLSDQVRELLMQASLAGAAPVRERMARLEQTLRRSADGAELPNGGLRNFPVPDLHVASGDWETEVESAPWAMWRRWRLRRHLQHWQTDLRMQLERYGMQVRAWALDRLDRLQRQWQWETSIHDAQRHEPVPEEASIPASILAALRDWSFSQEEQGLSAQHNPTTHPAHGTGEGHDNSISGRGRS